MKLEKIELNGFKSFPEKTVLYFEPGITAIVGPNGSGKSNILDAIRWALGEQSVKELRGAQMEDVIFNGTDTRAALGMAEVSLTFSNEDKKLSIEDSHVTVTRRIFRSGENEYLINNNPVRLKDINDLFSGTGVGIDSYSLIGQGKIDLILSSKPEDRRIIFDEASGILKYKLQKKETKKKLEETENNLLRINDIIGEVRRQINSLERQANKARRYQELFNELKEKEKILGVLKIHKINSQKDVVLKQLELYNQQEVTLRESYQESIACLQRYEEEFRSIRDGLFKIKEEVINIEHQLQRNQELRVITKERTEELNKQKENFVQQIDTLKEKNAQIQKEIDNFYKAYEELKGMLIEKTSLLQTKESRLKEINQLKNQTKENIENAKKEIVELNNFRIKIKNELIDLATQLKVKEAREKRLKIEEMKCQEEKNGIQQSFLSEKNKLSALENDFFAKQQTKNQIEERLKLEANRIEELKNHVQDLEKENERLNSQKEFLENLNLNYEKIDATLNTVILTDNLPGQDFDGLVVRIKEKLDCNEADKQNFPGLNFKFHGEAKPIDFNLDKIINRIKEIEEQLQQEKKIISERMEENENLKKELENISINLHQLELDISQQKSQFNHIAEEVKKIDEELEIVLLELSEISEEIKIIKEKEVSLINEDKNLENTIQAKESFIKDENDRIACLDLERENTLLEVTQIKTEQGAIKENLQREDQALKVLKDNLMEVETRIKDYQDQIADSEEKIKKLIIDLDNFVMSEQELIAEKQKKIEEEKQKESNLSEYSLKVEELKREIEKMQMQKDQVNNCINDFKITVQNYDFEILNIKNNLKQIYRIDLEQDNALTQDANEEVLSSEINALKEKLDSLGTVNLVAIEEYDEFKKRYDFLAQQQVDLIQAKESLEEAIHKINRTARSLFLDTFQKINQEFQGYFKLFFAGGEANLYLIDENNPLESGIEIIARPPGKKLQNISLLSGGEKTLCAISLIFAIFKVKPSPFCILDEVDAALDEANISRYAGILGDFAKYAQFLVITHNKRTLLNADAMYGITMEEAGVSKIVSVKFAEREKEAQEEPASALT